MTIVVGDDVVGDQFLFVFFFFTSSFIFARVVDDNGTVVTDHDDGGHLAIKRN